MILGKIKALLGSGGYLEDDADMLPYLTSWRGGYRGKALLIAFPDSVKQLSELVGLCHHARIGMVAQGGNTGLVGGATPSAAGDEIVIVLSRMNAIRAVDAANYTLTAEAGATLAKVQEAAGAIDRLFPLSMASEGSATVGGFVSTNAGGTAVLRYGTTRQLVMGIEAVLPNGEVLHDLHTLRKDNTGYAMRQLFIGAEGTLGIISAASLTLFPKPKQRETAFLAIHHPDAMLELLSLFREETGDSLTAFELISVTAMQLVEKHIPGAVAPLHTRAPYYLLVEASSAQTGDFLRQWFFSALEKAMHQELIANGVLAENLAQQKAFWHLREHISEAARKEGRGVHFDVSVPIAKVPDFLRVADARVKQALPEVQIVSFGHVGDGNVHYNLCLPFSFSDAEFEKAKATLKDLIYRDIREHSGSISAEHGIGVERVQDLYNNTSRVEYDMMQKLKRALDPHLLMNLGKILSK